MASNNGSTSMDYAAHNATYAGFIGLVKWGTILSILVAAGAVALLVHVIK